jgi:type I restriction enzyme R subunit
LKNYAKFKKDVAARLAHKDSYKRIELSPEKQIDLLIVVNQMLTGFDSKWVNTLYLDKILYAENIIQAFSRTNRLFGPDKPFGTIRYYRKPHTMTRLIDEAVKLYSGDSPTGLFVQRLPENLTALNEIFAEIKKVFEAAEVPDFEKNPDDKESCGMFAKLFKAFHEVLEAAKIQGFQWGTSEYVFKNHRGHKYTVKTDFDETAYLILAQRYKELFYGENGGEPMGDVPFEIDGHLTEIDTGKIDADYMNSRFTKYLRALSSGEAAEQTLNDLHKTFAALTQEEQKFASIFLREIQRGEVTPEDGKTLRDYITEYQSKAKDDRIHKVASVFGLDEARLRDMAGLKLTAANLNEYGRYDSLKKTADRAKAKAYFEKAQKKTLSPPRVNIALDHCLRKFLLDEQFDAE